jgi:hypothetical protein
MESLERVLAVEDLAAAVAAAKTERERSDLITADRDLVTPELVQALIKKVEHRDYEVTIHRL